MNLVHWNYFLAIEQSVVELSRYIEFHNNNMDTYSIEIARLLMTTTQEIDVLLKQICSHFGNSSNKEGSYRTFFPSKYPKMLDIEIVTPRYNLTFKPFENWQNNTTPTWWTANNKVKHQRHTHYPRASLANVLNAVSGLFVVNLYYYIDVKNTNEIYPAPKLFASERLFTAVTPTAFGMIPVFKLP